MNTTRVFQHHFLQHLPHNENSLPFTVTNKKESKFSNSHSSIHYKIFPF